MKKTGTPRNNNRKTKERIIASAEVLFGEKGFDAVSLRDITDHANVTLALASYHFVTKQNLFETVVAERAGILCRDRQDRLAKIGDGASVRSLLDAFMAPLFEQVKSGHDGWTSYTQLLARLGEGTRWIDILEQYFDGTARLFLEKLMQCEPDADPERVARGFTMVIQAMLTTVSQHPRLDSLTQQSARAADLDAAYAALLDFAEAGLTALCR